MDKSSIEQFSAQVAVGSLVVLGLFLIFDGLFDIVRFVDFYSKTAAWAVVATIPFVVVSYLLGLVSIELGALFAERLPVHQSQVTLSDQLDLLASANDHVIRLFQDLLRRRDVLRGAAIASPFLAVGSLLERRNMPGIEGLAWIGALGALAVAVVCLVLSVRFSHAIVELIADLRIKRGSQPVSR